MSNSESNSDKISVEASDPESIPQALRERDRWVCWRYEQDKKPPYDPKTEAKASTNDPETWADFETAINRFREGNYDGIGFVLTDDGPFVGVDFDYCRDPDTGEIQQEVEEIIGRFGSYSEISPSKIGLHTLAIGEIPERFESRSGDGIEVYDSGQYFTVTGKHLEGTPETIEERDEELRRVCETYLTARSQCDIEDDYDVPDITEPENEHLELGQKALEELQEESPPTFRAVMDFLQGGIADFDTQRLTKESGLIDRSSQESVGISLLYCTLKCYLDESEQTFREATWATWTHYCRAHPTTAHSQKRRWLTDTADYRELIFTNALATADDEKFEQMVQKKGTGVRCENNEYSAMTYGAIWDALFEQLPELMEVQNSLASSPHLYNDMDPGNPEPAATETDGHIAREAPEVHELYPGKSEVIDRAHEIDNEYNARRTYEEAFRRLQATFGEVKAARIGSSTWVYYPAEYPDPPEACSVRQYGEKYDPEVADEINSWTGEPEISEASDDAEELLTDGGTCTSDARDDLERIREAREGPDEPTAEPEVFRCPIEGCSRTIIADPTDLRSHVRNAGDDDHRYRTLSEDMEVVVQWEQMNWGPGAPET